jgi:hypothetical protein
VAARVAEPADEVEPEAGAEEERRITPFEMLLGGLGAQVQIALGRLADPSDGSTSVDLPGARAGIDMLSALEEKTRGNLTPAEANLLAGLLAELRMAYVRRARETPPAS